MRILGFLVQNRAATLYPFMTRLVDIVVKSLDPRFPEVRKGMAGAVTQCLQDMVQTPGQRLAIGTLEGAVVVMDLRTATPCLVLEGHLKPVLAVAFSPDGKLIASYSAAENRLAVWETTTNLFSMLASSLFASVKTRGRSRTHDAASLGPPPVGAVPPVPYQATANGARLPSNSTDGTADSIATHGGVLNNRPTKLFPVVPIADLVE
ncbi:hypothetical protein H4R33_007274, partial [Dimargaris cristalligena]